jgi:hypothetical protein
MLRFAEIGFFFLPFILYLAWRLLGPRATPGLLWATAALVAALAATTLWYGLEHSLPAGSRYVPAKLQNGVVVPGHGG